jgi:purine nucleosidase
MSGEYVLDPQPVLGYIHRMHEKMAESRPVMGFMPNTARMDYVCALNTPFADFTLDCNASAIKANREWLGDPGLALPDPVTMAIALDPSVCTRKGKHYVDVETESELTRGMTVVDELGVLNRTPNIEVCWEIDPKRWKEALYKTLV